MIEVRGQSGADRLSKAGNVRCLLSGFTDGEFKSEVQSRVSGVFGSVSNPASMIFRHACALRDIDAFRFRPVY